MTQNQEKLIKGFRKVINAYNAQISDVVAALELVKIDCILMLIGDKMAEQEKQIRPGTIVRPGDPGSMFGGN